MYVHVPSQKLIEKDIEKDYVVRFSMRQASKTSKLQTSTGFHRAFNNRHIFPAVQ